MISRHLADDGPQAHPASHQRLAAGMQRCPAPLSCLPRRSKSVAAVRRQTPTALITTRPRPVVMRRILCRRDVSCRREQMATGTRQPSSRTCAQNLLRPVELSPFDFLPFGLGLTGVVAMPMRRLPAV